MALRVGERFLEKEPPHPAGTPPEEGNLRSLVWEGSFRSMGNSSGEGTTPPCGHPSRGGEFTLACLGGALRPIEGGAVDLIVGSLSIYKLCRRECCNSNCYSNPATSRRFIFLSEFCII
jgi:hypothetical protein